MPNKSKWDALSARLSKQAPAKTVSPQNIIPKQEDSQAECPADTTSKPNRMNMSIREGSEYRRKSSFPDGEYAAQITDYSEESYIDKKTGKEMPKIRLMFEIHAEGHSAIASMTIFIKEGSENDSWKWPIFFLHKAAGLAEDSGSFEVDWDALPGHWVQARVENKTYNGRVYRNITRVMPIDPEEIPDIEEEDLPF